MKKILAFGIVIAMMFALAISATAAPITITAPKGTPAVDGVFDAGVYGDWTALGFVGSGPDPIDGGADGRVAAAWDDEWIYVFVEANDPTPFSDNSTNWQTDNVEFFFDWNNYKGETIDNDDNPFWQARIHRAPGAEEFSRTGHANGDWQNEQPNDDHPFYHIRYAIVESGSSYTIEAAFPRSAIEGGFTFAEGTVIGFDVTLSDAQDNDDRYSTAFFYASEDDQMWQNPSHLKALLVLGAAAPPPAADGGAAASGGGAVTAAAGSSVELAKIDRPLADLTEVKWGDRVLERDVDYTAREGSTIITLTQSFIDSLPEGTHTIAISFGSEVFEQEVARVAAAPAARPSPRTNDAGIMALIALMAIAAAGIVIIRRKAVR